MEKKIIKTAQELFDAEVKVSGAKFIDEVADIHYYYVENEDNAHLYMYNEVSNSYDLAIFPKSEVLIKSHPLEFATSVSPILDTQDANELFNKIIADGDKDFENMYYYHICFWS